MKIIPEIVTEAARRVMWKLADLNAPMSVVTGWQERLYAERESAAMLELYQGVRTANPQLAGKKLYVEIVARRLECDEQEAAEIVRHADESYAQWPDVRDLTFRDVVRYVVVYHLLSQHTGRVGTKSNTERTVVGAIPGDL